MSVFRELSFPYLGEAVTFTPSLAILRRIKARGINNVMLANRCINGGVDIEDLAAVHSELMRAGGRDVSEEESYSYLTGDSVLEIMEFQQAYVQAVLPSVDFGKKPEAQAIKPKATGKRKATPKT